MVLGQGPSHEEGQAHEGQGHEGKGHEGQGLATKKAKDMAGKGTGHESTEEVSSWVVKDCQSPNRSKTDGSDTS